jgi:hypothetical protein
MKFFNTSGPVNSKKHYHLDPLTRWDMSSVLMLIEQEKYFVVHAPRQTGKTSCILALSDYLNAEGKFQALYVNVEPAQAYREDVGKAMVSIYNRLAESEKIQWKTNLLDRTRKEVFDKGGEDLLSEALYYLSIESHKPIVLLIDEIDSLVGDTLISVLRQLRAGYTNRPEHFPQSVVLCGVRDVRDYRMHSTNTGKDIITGGSAFNIKDKSLRLGNFTREDICLLYKEHTKETGQEFEEAIFELVWQYTGGQPWLVNALAYEACFEMKENRDRTRTITVETFQRAKETLILRRDTHLDQLSDKLKEDRVRHIIEPILKGEDSVTQFNDNDIQYVIDLGLIIKQGNLKIANGIYSEIIPRELTYSTQVMMVQESQWYVDKPTNKLNYKKLLTAFQAFFQENSESWIQMFNYREAGPQLLLQAFLQRVINGGGIINREYGLGTKRTDLYIKWYPVPENYSISQKVVIECKLLRKSLDKTIQEGLEQVSIYADKCSAEETHLIIFDRTKDKPWEDKMFVKEMEYNQKPVTVWGM